MSDDPRPDRGDPGAAPSAKGRTRRVVEFGAFTTALALLAVLLHRVGWDAIGSALAGVGWGFAALIAATGFSENALDALALRSALGKARYARVLLANSAGSLVNLLLPWDLGEVAKGALLGSEAPVSDRVAGIVIWNYLFKLTRPIVSLGAAVAGAVLHAGVLADDVIHVVLAANVVAFLPYVVLRLVLGAGPARLVLRLTQLVPALAQRTSRFVASAESLDAAVRDFARERPRDHALVLAAQIGARLSTCAGLFVIIAALGLGYDLGLVLLLYAGLNVAEYVLTVLPARIGVAETAAYGLFAVYGLDPAAGLVVYVVLRLRVLATNGAIAPFALVQGSGTPAGPPP